ncbi:glycoside hydrolase domain-containing protein [Kitasatospora sp. NPDC088346]|uniref:glycoside hydrolase domain-containing protein n=1 Tax=Kitasatospora sp. NPDC088346 TaxID=3364073 RepID=UPI00381A9CCC
MEDGLTSPEQTMAAPPPPAAAAFTGLAFDTCTAPPVAAMAAWRGTSPYGAVAVYVGGRNRGCAQPQLTASWVTAVSAAGWRLVPLYVGAQPPCRTGGGPERITAATADSQGAADGADAVARASALGMRPGSTLYLDVEDYDAADTACGDAVLAYTQSFDRAVTARAYRPGFYGLRAPARPASPLRPAGARRTCPTRSGTRSTTAWPTPPAVSRTRPGCSPATAAATSTR